MNRLPTQIDYLPREWAKKTQKETSDRQSKAQIRTEGQRCSKEESNFIQLEG